MEAEKSNEKSKNHLIFQPPQPASGADPAEKPKFYKKRGRQRTKAKTKAVIVYRILRKKWPYGLSSYMQWYYDTNYMQKGSKFYAETQQWRQEVKAANHAA